MAAGVLDRVQRRLLRFEQPGSPRLRALTGAGALLAGVGVGAVSVALTAPEWRRLASMLAVVGVTALASTVAARRNGLPWAAAALTGAAALSITDHRGEAVAVVGLAAALVAMVELAGWSVDRRSIVPEGAAQVRRHLLVLVAEVVGAATLAAAMLLVGRLPAPGGALPLLVGTAAALGVTALLTLRRWDR